VHLDPADECRLDAEALRLIRRHRTHAAAEDVASRLPFPAELEQLALGEVGVAHHAALLVQHAAHVA
jgi:hypothetical protein